MKHILFFILSSLLILPPAVFAEQKWDGNESVEIFIIDRGSMGGEPSFHAPALIPIEAEYYPSMSTIMVNFLYPLGIVSVEIENQTAGTNAQTNVNASQGVHPFLISGTAGHWTITFTLSNGKVYFGEFDI